MDLKSEAQAARANGIEWINHPIPDRGVPDSVRNVLALVRQLEARLHEGKLIAFHCRQGIGRSALLAASVLTAAGLNPTAAFERITAARGCKVPETSEQREWVNRLARERTASAAPK